ncbi:MAG: uroporphyrinogen decarboxylase family protein [Planctomycetota bacterium]
MRPSETFIDPESKNKAAANYLRCAYFAGPDWIPCNVGLMPATWREHREGLEEVVLDFPRLFPGYSRGDRDFDAPGDRRYRRGRFTDNWGCTWQNVAPGLAAAPVDWPIKTWEDFDHYQPPDPVTEGEGRNGPPDWQALRRRCERAKEQGRLAWGGMPHGSMYMRLYYLRGFENLMADLATDEPRLRELIEMVLDYNLRMVEKNIECGAEIIGFGDDLGMQTSLPMSPAKWRRYLLPCYERLFGLCRRAGVEVRLHSDGHMLEIIPDLVRAGVRIINPQIRANGLEGLERTARGEVCIHLDLDRQLFPFAGPDRIREHILEAVDRLGRPDGGLMLHAECEPDVPLQNIRAICETLDRIGGPLQ